MQSLPDWDWKAWIHFPERRFSCPQTVLHRAETSVNAGRLHRAFMSSPDV